VELVDRWVSIITDDDVLGAGSELEIRRVAPSTTAVSESAKPIQPWQILIITVAFLKPIQLTFSRVSHLSQITHQ
jgi:hypothetical protein